MKKYRKIQYVVCSILTVALVGTAVFFPQFYNQMQDKGYLNQVTLSERKNISFSYDYNTSIESKLEILGQPAKLGKDFLPVKESKGSVVDEKKLISSVKAEMDKLEQTGWFPMASVYDYESFFVSADLYSMDNNNCPDNPNDTVLFWYIRFSDYINFEYIFCMDIYTNTIYCASLIGAGNSSSGSEYSGIKLENRNNLIKKGEAGVDVSDMQSFENICKNYYGVQTVKDIDSSIMRAQLLCGKTEVQIEEKSFWDERMGYLSENVVFGVAGMTIWLYFSTNE